MLCKLKGRQSERRTTFRFCPFSLQKIQVVVCLFFEREREREREIEREGER